MNEIEKKQPMGLRPIKLSMSIWSLRSMCFNSATELIAARCDANHEPQNMVSEIFALTDVLYAEYAQRYEYKEDGTLTGTICQDECGQPEEWYEQRVRCQC